MSLEKLDDFEEIEVVYGIQNKITKKWYIGSTFNMYDRMRRHRYHLLHGCHHSLKLLRSFNKYGINNFEVFILEKFDKLDIDDLINREIDYIVQYDSLENGYNMTKDCRRYKSFKLTKEQVNKAILGHSKAIVCLDLDGNFIKEYPSVSEAARELNDQSTNISKACKEGCSHSVKGFILLYKSDYDPEKEYRYMKYRPLGEHLRKMINNSRVKCARKVYEYKNGEIIKIYNSASELERELLLKTNTLKSFYNKSKEETKFKVKDRVFKIEKSRSYKDIV